MKKTFTFTLLILSLYASAQFLEFGVHGGISNYAGDLVRGINFNTTSPHGGGSVRFNFSEIVTLRLGVSYGQVKSSETPIDAFAIQRNHKFKHDIYEVSAVLEYHFLDFKNFESYYRYSPYLFGGIGIMNIQGLDDNIDANNVQPVIPFGGGVKLALRRDKKYILGFEVGLRKTFFDYLDGVSDGDQTIKNYQYGNPNDDDWYAFSGFSFSVRILNIPCPYQYIPNKILYIRR